MKKIQKRVCIDEKISNAVRKIFNEDEIKMLTLRYKKMPKWCDATLIKG